MEKYEVTMSEITRYKVIQEWGKSKVKGKGVSMLWV